MCVCVCFVPYDQNVEEFTHNNYSLSPMSPMPSFISIVEVPHYFPITSLMPVCVFCLVSGKVRVICRVRPNLTSEAQHSRTVECIDSNSLCVQSRVFSFDRVLDPFSSNDDVYDEVSDLVEGVLKGFSLSVFAYGATGSGKTYSMSSLNLKVMSYLFSRAKEHSCHIKLSVVEIYNQNLVDLLNKATSRGEASSSLEIGAPGSMPHSCIRVPNLIEIEVSSFEEAWELIRNAEDNRQTHATLCNSSSRFVGTITILIHSLQPLPNVLTMKPFPLNCGSCRFDNKSNDKDTFNIAIMPRRFGWFRKVEKQWS